MSSRQIVNQAFLKEFRVFGHIHVLLTVMQQIETEASNEFKVRCWWLCLRGNATKFCQSSTASTDLFRNFDFLEEFSS